MAAPDGVLTCWSTGAEQLLGLSAAEAVGLPAAELLASALPAAARERFARQEGWTGLVALRHQDGSAMECRLRVCPLPLGDGRAGWLLEGVRVREGTERDTDPLIRWSFDQSPFSLAIYDSEGRFLRVNEPMAKQLAASERELRELRITEHMPDQGFQAPERSVDRVLQTGEPEHIENYVRVPGEPHAHAWIVHFTPLKDSLGLVHGVQLAALDFSEQYAARERLALLNEASRSIGSSLDVPRTAQELADVAVPALAEFVSVDLLDAVLRGDEPPPIPVNGPLLLRRTAIRSGVKPAVTVGELARYPEFSPPVRCLATGHGSVHQIGEPEITR